MHALTLFFVILFVTLLLAGGLRFTVCEFRRLTAESEDRNLAARSRRLAARRNFGLVR
jgi:hypothetical protein